MLRISAPVVCDGCWFGLHECCGHSHRSLIVTATAHDGEGDVPCKSNEGTLMKPAKKMKHQESCWDIC